MKMALVVGINNYPTAPLKGCVNDARAMAKALKVNGDKSPNFEVKILENVKTKAELKSHIIKLFSGEYETALLYFSGHGFLSKSGGGIIVTPDHQKFDEGILMDEILNIANASSVKNKVIVLDCCYSGSFGAPKSLTSNISQIGVGVSILTASKANEVSVEVNGHGIFTSLLLGAFQGGAADLRGHITPGSIYSYIDKALGAWGQRPVFKTNITSFTSLKIVKPQVSLETIRELKNYFITAEDHYQLNPSFEFTNDPNIEHKYIEPYAAENNVAIFKKLQKLVSIGLIIPVDEKHMYFAAMNSKSCKLTALGHYYWKLAKEGKI